MITKHFKRLMSAAVLLLTSVSLSASVAVADDLQGYLDNLAAKNTAKANGQSAGQKVRREQTVTIPVDIPVVDLSTFNSATNRTTTLDVKTDVRFTNGTISSNASFTGGGCLVKVSNGATVIIDNTAHINSALASSDNCLTAIGVYGGSTLTQYGDITAPSNGTGYAVYLDTKADTYNYISGNIKGKIRRIEGETSDFAGYNGQTWMVGKHDPIRYDFADINAAMASSMVKDGDILLVGRYSTGSQTVSKSVKIVGNKYKYESENNIEMEPTGKARQKSKKMRVRYKESLYIEAPNVTVDGLYIPDDIIVRDENARIEHCSILGNIVAGDNYECDCAFINSNRVGTAIDAGSAYDWTITNNYINGTFSGDLSEYSNYPIDMPYFSEFSLPSTGTTNSTIAFKYIITNVSSINYMEYFWDTDPGWGKGTLLKNANNNYVTNAWNEPLNISTTSLSTGSHTLVIRARSGSGYWVTAVNSVTIQSAPVTNPKPVFSTYQFPTSGYNNNYVISFSVAAEGGLIDCVEYFWDTDPGEKHGTIIVDGGHDSGSGITHSSYAINCQGLTGKHTLYLRAFCGTESTTVYVKEINLSAPPVADDRINANDLAALKLISDNLGLNGYWNFANEGRLEGDFPGVTFVNHRVTEINLSNHAFGGTLSESWMPSLPEITLLNLSRNNIYGDLTPLVYRMPKLKTLDVSHNRILQISGPLPASITSLNVKSQMRVFSNSSSGSYESIVLVLPTGMSSATAKLGANVSLTLPSLFNYNASRNDNSLRADIQVVNTSQPSTVYGTYSYNGEGKGWKFTPIQTSSMSFADKTNVAIVTTGTAQQFSAYPAQLSVVLGDANIDGDVDVLDVQHTLNYILATAQPFNYWAANTYVDQRINVQDIVCTVNIMLGLPNNVRQGSLARSITYNGNPESSETQCWVYEENSRIAIAPTTDVAAVDIEIEGAGTDEVSLLLNHKQFQMIGQNTPTGSRYVIFSPTGNTIPAEKVSALLALSHSAQPVAVRCADVKAREVVTTIGQTTGITEVTPRYGEQTVIETRLAPGVYIVRTVGTNGESKTVKIIKK